MQNYIGIVVDNKDPLRLGRVKIRVINLYDNIEDDNLPWALPIIDNNGNVFSIPDIKKVLNIIIIDNNLYNPYYSFCEHFNDELDKMLSNSNNYETTKAIIYDHLTKIYRDKNNLHISHNLSNITIDKDANIELNLKGANSNITLGSNDAEYSILLGDKFIDAFCDLVDKLLNGYNGNYMSPLIPSPQLIKEVIKFKSMKSMFKSKHIKVVDNNKVKTIKSSSLSENKQGDNINVNTENDKYKLDNVPSNISNVNESKELNITNYNDILNNNIDDIVLNKIPYVDNEESIITYESKLSSYNISPIDNNIPDYIDNDNIFTNLVRIGLSQIGVQSYNATNMSATKNFIEYCKFSKNKDTKNWSAIFVSFILGKLNIHKDFHKNGITSDIIKETLKTTKLKPELGDIFVLYDNKVSHCGFVISINGDKIITIEGNYKGKVSSVERNIKNINSFYKWL